MFDGIFKEWTQNPPSFTMQEQIKVIMFDIGRVILVSSKYLFTELSLKHLLFAQIRWFEIKIAPGVFPLKSLLDTLRVGLAKQGRAFCQQPFSERS